MDTQHVQQLAELLDTVRSTMQEQVIYNIETVSVVWLSYRYVCILNFPSVVSGRSLSAACTRDISAAEGS